MVFNCHVEFPDGHPVPYVLQWEKKVGDTVGFFSSLLSICGGRRIGIRKGLVTNSIISGDIKAPEAESLRHNSSPCGLTFTLHIIAT